MSAAMKTTFFAALAALGFIVALSPVKAADTPVTAGGYNDFGCAPGIPALGGSAICTGITRPANTTAYASGQLVCGATCAPITIVAGRPTMASSGSGLIDKVVLLKTGPTTTGTFNVFLYSNVPTFAGLADQSAYVGPYKADITSGIYVGQATCSTGQATSDGSPGTFYVCSLDAQAMTYRTTGKILYAAIEATAAYTPVSQEQFYVLTYELQD